MWIADLYRDIGHEVRRASPRDLLITAGAMLGVAVLPAMIGVWFMTGSGHLMSDYDQMQNSDALAPSNRNDPRWMAIYYGAAGWTLLGIAALLVGMAITLVIRLALQSLRR